MNPGINAEFQDDKRFHPVVIGSILVIFMLGVAYFISYMEGMDYFNSFYACFITYSTIGFGDMDIYVSTSFILAQPVRAFDSPAEQGIISDQHLVITDGGFSLG